ncbi:hypothetical protein EDB86DRAFT_3212067 [Lactarius hatsudake]|nr:hypothetical protein EDB86DRAFT_3212067 [Lactarius hatsudake]
MLGSSPALDSSSLRVLASPFPLLSIAPFPPLFPGFRAQCSSSLAFSNVPHWRAALATPARHNPDPNGHLCEVSHHADACTTTSDHLRPTNPISIPDLAALARGSSHSIPTCPQSSRTHIRQLVPREGLRDTDDWVSSRFFGSLLIFFVTYTPICYLNNNYVGLYDDGLPLRAEHPRRTCTRARPLPLCQLGLAQPCSVTCTHSVNSVSSVNSVNSIILGMTELPSARMPNFKVSILHPSCPSPGH